MSGPIIPITVTEDSNNEWTNWLEEAIAKNYFKYYEYNHFNNIEEIGSGSFGKVYRAKWKSSHSYLALKTFFNFNNITTKEVVNELRLQREVDFHENIIRFFGITTQNQNDSSIKYWLIMEYADSGTLQEYLKEHFHNLTWNNKLNLAFQLAHAVLCLHDEGIVHRDLHSKNSDIYSIGVLLWEISSGQPPFKGMSSYSLIIQISQGLRETPLPDTPTAYINLYTECWNYEPDNRPTIIQVVDKLKALKISQTNINFNIVVDEIVVLYEKENNKVFKQNNLNYLNDSYNMTLQEFYNWNWN
ncbi:kinase-like domain-containing protein [Rhizophagus irregularis DAOM 181602=DAOM 197198]|nr:kinase-like domain-containing protein [Rhizophagus irregularis DAOM 181602=DAOM 197198]